MQYLQLVLPLIKKKYSQHQYNPTQLSAIAVLYHRHLSHVSAIIPAVAVFFPKKQQCSLELLANARGLNVTKNQIEYFYQQINGVSDWSLTIIQRLITAYQTKFQVTKKLLYMPLRMMCTLEMHGPELPQMLLLLGRSRVQANILFFKAKIAVS